MVINVAPLHKSQYKGQDRNLLSFNRKVMRMAGIIPQKNLSKSPTKMILFVLYLISWYCMFMLLYIGQILAIFHFWGNMETTTFALVGFLGATMTQLEGIYGRLYSRSILKLLEFLEHDVNSKMEELGLNENHIQILENAKVKARRLNIIMIVMIDVMMTCWIIFPITIKYLREHNNDSVNVTTVQYEDRWLDFCYIIWAPFDITVSPYYEITYICQIIELLTTTAHWKSVETTIMALIIYTSAHLKILETSISEMKTSLFNDCVNGVPAYVANNIGTSAIHDSVKQLDTAELNQECLTMDRLQRDELKSDKQKMTDSIINTINYHVAIIEFVGKVNKTFGPVLFISFFVRQLMACLGLYQMAMTELDGASVTNLATCCAIMMPHFVFCWYGNEVIENSQLVKQAAFESSLAHRSKEFKHFILMLMKNTQQALQFSALGFYTLSLEEFATTMNGAYAYFNILKNLHGEQ